MKNQEWSAKHFLTCLFLLCLTYLGFEWFYNTYQMLVVDEFWFAHRIYQFKEGLPYRDFAPYKTVLGYYLLLVPLLFSHGAFQALVFSKQCIALLNSALFFMAAFGLKRFFPKHAILFSLALLFTSQIVLSFSTQIRVDLLGYWLCLFAFLLVLEKHYQRAGLLLGLAFLITQKTLWYILATNAALGCYWLIYSRNWRDLMPFLRLNGIIAGTIFLYILGWSTVADWHTLLSSIFYEASVIYRLDWYDSARAFFWTQILVANPLLFLLCPYSLLSLLITFKNDYFYPQRFLVTLFALTIFVLLIPYKLVFPYYMQVIIPAALLLYTAFFAWVYALFQHKGPFILRVKPLTLWSMTLTMICLMLWLQIYLALPFIYFVFCLIPIFLLLYVTQPEAQTFRILFAELILILSGFGVLFPLCLFIAQMPAHNNTYQKATIKTLTALVSDGSDYVAGNELIYNKTQPIPGLRQLIGPAIEYLYHPTEKLRQVMLPSLYGSPDVSPASIMHALDQSQVKCYVNNYRMETLPPVLKTYLASHFSHYTGSIYIYTPTISAGKNSYFIKFTGTYVILAKDRMEIAIDGQKKLAQDKINLVKGEHVFAANASFRLALTPLPEIKKEKDQWQKVFTI